MKRNFNIGLLVAVALLLTSSLAIPKAKEAPVTGTWNCQAHGGSQGDIPFTLYLQQDGTNVDGSVTSDLGDTQLSSGTFKDGKLEIHIDAPDGEYVLLAELSKDTLSGTWSHNEEKGSWEGKKQAGGTQ